MKEERKEGEELLMKENLTGAAIPTRGCRHLTRPLREVGGTSGARIMDGHQCPCIGHLWVRERARSYPRLWLFLAADGVRHKYKLR